MSRLEIQGGQRWISWARSVTAAFPLAGTDWEQHSDAVDAKLYSVQDWVRSRAAAPAPEPPPADPGALF